MASFLFIIATLLISYLIFIIIFSITNKKKKKDNNKAHGLPLPPGPKGWPLLGNLPQIGSKPHETLHKLSKTYGPLFRLRFGSVTVVVASSVDVASQFLRALDTNFSNRPPSSHAEHIAYNYSNIIFSPYGAQWRMLRRVSTTHLLSTKALDDMGHVREKEAAFMVDRLRRAENSAAGVVVGKELNVCVANALTNAMFGRRMFGDGDGGEFKDMVVEIMKLSAAFNISDFIPWLKPLDIQGLVGRMKRVHNWFDDLINKIIEERTIEGARADFLSVLLQQKENPSADQETKLTDGNIKALLLDMFVGGTDTTSSTVEWALVELIRHPDILAEVQKELDSIVGRSRLVKDVDLVNVPVLQAVIKETFRLHPPVPLLIPHTASEACEVAGYYVPKDATLLVNTWTIGRDPEVYPRPLEFDPSRFLPGGKQADVDLKGSHMELMPFGSGRRICVGMRLGLRMLSFLVANLAHGFDWALPNGLKPEDLNMDVEFGLTLERTVPLVARPIPRLDPKAYVV
ncbi:Flavonoid 3'-monooxygenase protein [Dioscorea alata]|uniref:Flavonoid 3'-monooxygenase protein n=1 Tax=Dioscorea alata TaxID=55571 RepID=A0ACB7UWX4_DIOAL|nr:Flavonoid 3'-monooxygenase protein [Dioscorea alata]